LSGSAVDIGASALAAGIRIRLAPTEAAPLAVQ
jgi:hypothetical protein